MDGAVASLSLKLKPNRVPYSKSYLAFTYNCVTGLSLELGKFTKEMIVDKVKDPIITGMHTSTGKTLLQIKILRL